MNYQQFTDFVNSELKRTGLDYLAAIKTERTYPSADQIEAGACRLIVTLKNIRYEDDFYSTIRMYCSYTLKFYNEAIKSGKQLKLIGQKRILNLSDLTIDVV